MGCGIYKITNLIDKKIYIGSSINLENREYRHFWMLKKGIHDNSHLQNSFNKYGIQSFEFDIIEECDESNLIDKENHYINFYLSNIQDYGYNMALVNEFRRNNYNNEVKQKISKFNLIKNGNFTTFSLTNIETNEEHIFESLVDGANYLVNNGFSKGKLSSIRMKLSNSLRGKKINNGKNNKGSIRKTCYKHKFKIIN
jgi:group I intron endonuclease